jgi:AraC-like DNA-binding protein
MTSRRRYGDAVAHSLGLNDAPFLTTRTLRKSQIGITRISCGAGTIGMTPQIPAEDTFIAAVHLTRLDHHELWSNGKRAISQGYAANSMRIVNLEAEYSAYIACAHEAVCFYIPRSVLNEFTDETGGRVDQLSCPPGIIDPVISHLVQALLPAFERPEEFPSIFTDHVALAILAHLVRRYGGLRSGQAKAIRGGLSLLQEKRAKDYLAANITGNVLLADVAKVCGLSRSYFIGAFAATTGLTPHKWLQRHRLQKAQTLLLDSSISIAEIAVLCGFADQSHLTRNFTQAVGTSPAAWRRAHQGRPPRNARDHSFELP